MPRPRPIPPFPWGDWSDDSSDLRFMRAINRRADTGEGQSKVKYAYESEYKYKSKSPAVIIGSFKLVNNDKMVEITSSRPSSFRIHVATNAKRALKTSTKASKANQVANFGMALVQWKKKNGTDATVTWYSPFADLKLDRRLPKQHAPDIYGRWFG